MFLNCNCNVVTLVAPYCAIPRDYLSDTPLLRAMGFLVSQHGQLGAIPPPPFLSMSPMKSMRSGGAIPPPQKGYLSDTGATPYEYKANGCDTPLCDTISKGYCAIWGGISHWAAKVATPKGMLSLNGCSCFPSLLCKVPGEYSLKEALQITLLGYHSPRKHYLPKKKYFRIIFRLPFHNYFRIIFRLPFHDFAFFEVVLKNYPIPIAFV